MVYRKPTLFSNTNQQALQSNTPILPTTNLPLTNNFYFYQSQIPIPNRIATNSDPRKRTHEPCLDAKLSNGNPNQPKKRNSNVKKKTQRKMQNPKQNKISQNLKQTKQNKPIEDETKPKVKVRRRTTKKELEYLRAKFVENSKMSVDQLHDIARVLGWDIKRVSRWFTNQRTRTPKDSLLLIERKQKQKTQNLVKTLQINSMTNSNRNMKFLRWVGEVSNLMIQDIARISRLDGNKLKDRENRITSIKHLQSLIQQTQQQIVNQRRREDRLFESISLYDDDEDDDDDQDEDLGDVIDVVVQKVNNQNIINNFNSQY
ncbi:short stature homeobox protein [Anaeramoeba flamelloides]|uniref:Short stature homeobox protein n=1 Tax=Anaeramoeba flamelloides TaxID=1746091 RepID=A0ABQ8XPG9_9EUKA|nr:short stature homeobox protein [Anaeramoeba flamelloides]